MHFKEEFLTRHYDIINRDSLGKKIVVVGAGAIGGFTVLALAKMGYNNIHVYDFDTVENENIGAQFFPIDAVGSTKVSALAQMVQAFTGQVITQYEERIAKGVRIEADIVISAVDNMATRRLIAEEIDCRYIIDPRMSAEYASLEVVETRNKEKMDNYFRTLYSDTDAVQERCTAKTTIYTVLLISGQVVKAVKDLYADKESITSMDWDIKNNALHAFSNGRKL